MLKEGIQEAKTSTVRRTLKAGSLPRKAVTLVFLHVTCVVVNLTNIP